MVPMSRLGFEHSIISHLHDHHGMTIDYHRQPTPFDNLSPTAHLRIWRDVHREAEAHGPDAAWALLHQLEAKQKGAGITPDRSDKT